MKPLRRLWRRVAGLKEPALVTPHCLIGFHRDTVETFGGYVLRHRCLDCGRLEVLGNVVRGSNKLHSHGKWERDDA